MGKICLKRAEIVTVVHESIIKLPKYLINRHAEVLDVQYRT